MTILKVYDTVLEAKYNAVNDYRDCAIRGLNVKFHTVHPYKIKIEENMDNDCYVYVANNPRYVLGMRFNKIEDYTRSGMCDEIRVCEYESKD